MGLSEEVELSNLLETNPLWYQDKRIVEYIKLFDKEKLTRSEKSLKNDFKKLLKSTNFYIGDKGYNWDQWRLPIEYAIIHHASSAPTISLRELNILGLRLYIQQYLTDNDVKDQPLYSGHYWYGKTKAKENMTFVSYHYLIRPNGKVIQLVDDTAHLWHAGNLEINRKSIAIAFAGKFIDKEPTTKALNSAAKIIKDHKIGREKVLGHCEVMNRGSQKETICPGNTFMRIWKSKLTDLL